MDEAADGSDTQCPSDNWMRTNPSGELLNIQFNAQELPLKCSIISRALLPNLLERMLARTEK